MAIKIAGTVKPDHNGLSVIYSSLIRDPEREHVIIAVVDTKSIATDTDSGEKTPTIRIRHVEVVGPESVHSARAMMQRAMESRNGELTLPFPEPFDNVRDIRTAGTVRPGRDEDGGDL